jgi:hypothetical protein
MEAAPFTRVPCDVLRVVITDNKNFIDTCKDTQILQSSLGITFKSVILITIASGPDPPTREWHVKGVMQGRQTG